MNIHQAIEYIEHSNTFKTFKKEHDDYYLVHGFCTFEKEEQSSWQIGYYSKKTKKIVSFNADKEITQMPADEAFIKKGHVEQLKEEDIKTELHKALEKAEAYREKNHSAELVTKRIILIQMLDKEPAWNITIITNIFSLINIRTNAKTGAHISITADSILNLGKRT